MQHNSKQPQQPLDNNPGQDNLEEISLRGREAKEFLRGLEEGSKYFLTVLNNLYNEWTAEILNLKPTEQERFTVLKTSIDTLFRPVQRVHEDIEAGTQAEEMLRGEYQSTKGGLL